MSAIGRMACSISHDMRHSLTAIYANAEFLERHDRSASTRTDLLLEIQEAVLAMTERLDSLLQFANSGRKNRPAHERVSLIVEKAVAAVKFHPDGQNVSIIVRKFPPAEADIDARNLESAMYNLLLNACQAATRSSHAKYTRLCMRIQDLPRHLGQHSSGMVICQGQLNSMVPLERASMPGRTVVQWDKPP
jgi:signal transduction histidine kinase